MARRLAATHDVTVSPPARRITSLAQRVPAGRNDRRRRPRAAVCRRLPARWTAAISERVFDASAGEELEEAWFRENGPDAPGLLDFLRQHGAEFDCILFWAFRYASSYFGVDAVPAGATRVVLVPTAENDPVIRFAATARLFTRPSGFVFLTPEEASLVAAHCPAPLAPSCIIGTGLEPAGSPGRAELPGPFLLYLGRVDPNKGCETLLRHYARWSERTDLRVPLVLAGPANMPIPAHPSIKHISWHVDDARRDALAGGARRCWSIPRLTRASASSCSGSVGGRPALVNGGTATSCAARRSVPDGALYYRTYDEFAHADEQLLES